MNIHFFIVKFTTEQVKRELKLQCECKEIVVRCEPQNCSLG